MKSDSYCYSTIFMTDMGVGVCQRAVLLEMKNPLATWQGEQYNGVRPNAPQVPEPPYILRVFNFPL
jgi:hypothetical protein